MLGLHTVELGLKVDVLCKTFRAPVYNICKQEAVLFPENDCTISECERQNHSHFITLRLCTRGRVQRLGVGEILQNLTWYLTP